MNHSLLKNRARRRGMATLAATAAALLAACGGGGGDPVTGSVFAEPSGTLCSQRDSAGICGEPTSSAVSADQLTALQQNPSGDRIRFNAIGVLTDAYVATTLPQPGVTTSSWNYALLEAPLVFGRNMVDDATDVYTYGGAANVFTARYVAGDNSLLLGAGGPSPGAPFSVTRTAYYAKSSGATGGISGSKTWISSFGPLTDRVDAPTDSVVQYAGCSPVWSGSGAQVRQGATMVSGDLSWGACPITLSLDVGSGKVTTGDAGCTDAQTKATIGVSLQPLYFSGSHIAGQIGSEAIVRIEGGPTEGFGGRHFASQFTSSAIRGAVYGKAAATIVLVGASPSGNFQIVAYRR